MINSELVKTVDIKTDETIVCTVTYGDEILKASESINYYHVVEDPEVPVVPSITTVSCSNDNALIYDMANSSYGYSDPVDGGCLYKVPDNYVVTGKLYQQPNTIKFIARDNTEMIKIADDGFYIRGKKLEQDDNEAKIVYQEFLNWFKNQSIGS